MSRNTSTTGGRADDASGLASPRVAPHDLGSPARGERESTPRLLTPAVERVVEWHRRRAQLRAQAS